MSTGWSRSSSPPAAPRSSPGGIQAWFGAGRQHSDPVGSGAPSARVGPHARGSVAFFTPAVCYDDARRYLPGLLVARQVDPVPALDVLDGFEAIVRAVEESVYASARAEALARIERRDAQDWAILATALMLGLPIWTEDQDFFGTGVPTWTTDRVELYLDSAKKE